MGLRDLIARDAAKLMRGQCGFSEEIQFRAEGEGELSVWAMVYRSPLSKQREDKGRSVSAAIVVEVLRTDWKLPVVGDEVKVSPGAGQEAKWMKVTEVMPRSKAEDAGVWRLGVGR